MSVPAYYRTANGREFWQWYGEQVMPVIADEFSHDQHHALNSAAEYLFRAGVKTSCPLDLRRSGLSSAANQSFAVVREKGRTSSHIPPVA